jgi:hypothetical protein
MSRSLRQSGELARKIFDAYESAGRTVPPEAETKQTLELSNGSRILALPGGDEGAIRGFSGVRCLVLDEAARIPDALWIAVRPMVAVSRGSMMVLSTPFGRRGFFYDVLLRLGSRADIRSIGVYHSGSAWRARRTDLRCAAYRAI